MPSKEKIERSRQNRIAHAVAREEMVQQHTHAALMKYAPELKDIIHPDEMDVGELRRRRAQLTDEQCASRICNLIAYGVPERKACRMIGVIWTTEWNAWKQKNSFQVEQQVAFAKLIRINSMHDEMMAIVDDPDLRVPDTKAVDELDKDGKKVTVEKVILSPRDKLAIAQARVEARKWSLEKLAPAFTPKQMSMVQSISQQVSLDELTPAQAMERYREMIRK
jgi:hypothetical protein